LQKVKILEKLDELHKGSSANKIDTTIANKRPKEAFNNAMSFTF
jgi:hypothetical protein